MKMKKITAALLGVSCMLSMGTTAFADAPTPNNNEAEIKATYSEEIRTPDVYYVDVEWGSLEYTYNSGKTRIWNPSTLKFTEKTGSSSWTNEEGANTITVTNHSNTGVLASFSYEQKDGSGINGTLSNSSFYLDAAAEGSELSSAPKNNTVLTLSGVLSDTATEKTAVGTVNVNIEAGYVYYNNKLKDFRVCTTEQPGIYTGTYSAKRTEGAYITFRIGEFLYGIDHMNKKLGKSQGVQVNCTQFPVETGHTYQFIFDTNNLTYTFEDITE